MAARLPVITMPVGDAEVIVKDGLTGYVVNDIQSIADRMVRLAQNRELSTQLGHAGRRRVEQEYNFRSLSGRLLSIFSDFVRQQGRGSLGGISQNGDRPGLSLERHKSYENAAPAG